MLLNLFSIDALVLTRLAGWHGFIVHRITVILVAASNARAYANTLLLERLAKAMHPLSRPHGISERDASANAVVNAKRHLYCVA